VLLHEWKLCMMTFLITQRSNIVQTASNWDLLTLLTSIQTQNRIKRFIVDIMYRWISLSISEWSLITLSWMSWMIRRRSLSELSIYFLSWKYRWFLCSSHLIKKILLWCCASLQSTSIIWAVNLSLISTCFHNVWVKVSIKSSSRFKMSWFSWDLMFSTLNSSIKNRCN